MQCISAYPMQQGLPQRMPHDHNVSAYPDLRRTIYRRLQGGSQDMGGACRASLRPYGRCGIIDHAGSNVYSA